MSGKKVNMPQLILFVLLADFNWPRPLPRDVMGVGLASGFVFTNVSNLPRSGIMSVTANAFGYDFQLLEVISNFITFSAICKFDCDCTGRSACTRHI